MLREMLEGEPPYMDLPSAKALFLIITKGLPPLVRADQYSPELNDFLERCLRQDPAERYNLSIDLLCQVLLFFSHLLFCCHRPSAMALLQHPFLMDSCSSAEFGNLVTKLKKGRKESNDDCVIS